MTEHADVFGLLRLELSNAEAVAMGGHLTGCATCQEELADAAVGHALLARAATTLGPAGATMPTPSPPRVAPSHPRPWRPVVAAAAAVVLAAAISGVAWWQHRSGTVPVAGTEVEAPLSPLSTGGAGDGTVQMTERDGRTRMTFAVRDLPQPGSKDFYCAWLLDPATSKMLALGVVDPDGRASFDLDDALVASYSAIDVSLEADDGDPAHSATSVLRGSYQPDQITTTEGKQR